MGNSISATLLVGFLLGLRHATDTDHIVAVSTLVSDTTGARRAARVGAYWGLGHLMTIFVVGSALIVLRVGMTSRVQWTLDLMVALVLMWLGVRTIRKCFIGRYHFHRHEHGEVVHRHLHFHAHSESSHQHDSESHLHARRGLGHGAQPLIVGMAHGLAGTAGLALLVLSSIPSRAVGVAYLLVFGLGALTGMAAFSALLGLPFARAAARLTWLNAMRLVAGAGSGILGAVLAYRAFFPQSWPF